MSLHILFGLVPVGKELEGRALDGGDSSPFCRERLNEDPDSRDRLSLNIPVSPGASVTKETGLI